MKRLVLAFMLCAGTAHAWEPETNAGIAEQAAARARLHERLARVHGRALGGYEPLAVTRAAAPIVHEKLGLIEPASGLAPDARGRMSAFGWLAAGAMLEEIPASRTRNHFFDPSKKRGLGGGGVGALKKLSTGSAPALGKGVAAPAWLTSPDNDLGLDRFWKELELSATAAAPAARERHLAFALLGAGAMTAVLADLAAPSRVRLDVGAHLERVGPGTRDLGSRLERVAAIAYGRLGVPPGVEVARPARLADLFSSADGRGLADETLRRWYSPGTLPGEVEAPPGRPDRAARLRLADRLARGQAFPEPRPADLDLDLARRPEGAVLRDAGGTCLAVYRIDDQARLGWSIPDECALEQLAVMLPTAVGHAAALLDWLLRGELAVQALPGQISVRAETPLGPGRLRVFVDDADGMRRELGAADSADGSGVVAADAPAGARVTAVFVGKDAQGEQVVAIGVASP